MLPTHQPHHPGEFIRQDILDEYQLDEQQLAEKLNYSKASLEQVITGQTKLSADLAWRLAKFTKTTPELWINLQTQLDLWQAYQGHQQEIQQIKEFDTSNQH